MAWGGVRCVVCRASVVVSVWCAVRCVACRAHGVVCGVVCDAWRSVPRVLSHVRCVVCHVPCAVCRKRGECRFPETSFYFGPPTIIWSFCSSTLSAAFFANRKLRCVRFKTLRRLNYWLIGTVGPPSPGALGGRRRMGIAGPDQIGVDGVSWCFAHHASTCARSGE